MKTITENSSTYRILFHGMGETFNEGFQQWWAKNFSSDVGLKIVAQSDNEVGIEVTKLGLDKIYDALLAGNEPPDLVEVFFPLNSGKPCSFLGKGHKNQRELMAQAEGITRGLAGDWWQIPRHK